MPTATMRPIDSVRSELEQRLAKLTTRVDKIERDLRRNLEADWSEQAQRAENDEVLESLDDHGIDEIHQIRAALKRMEDGTYGDCARCEEPIGAGRLNALPYATTCIRCAELAS